MTSTSTQDGERLVLSLGMALLGALAVGAGVDVAREWPLAALGSRVYGVLSLVGGATAVILGAWTWRRRKRVRGAAAATFAVLTLNQAAGLIGGTILCHSPG